MRSWNIFVRPYMSFVAGAAYVRSVSVCFHSLVRAVATMPSVLVLHVCIFLDPTVSVRAVLFSVVLSWETWVLQYYTIHRLCVDSRVYAWAWMYRGCAVKSVDDYLRVFLRFGFDSDSLPALRWTRFQYRDIKRDSFISSASTESSSRLYPYPWARYGRWSRSIVTHTFIYCVFAFTRVWAIEDVRPSVR